MQFTLLGNRSQDIPHVCRLLYIYYSLLPIIDVTLSFLVCPTKHVTFPFLEKVPSHINEYTIFSLHSTHKTTSPKILCHFPSVPSTMGRREYVYSSLALKCGRCFNDSINPQGIDSFSDKDQNLTGCFRIYLP